MQQQQIVRSGNYNENNVSLFQNTEGLTQGMVDGSCVDGVDDGKIGFKEGLKSFGKGIVKNFTNMFSSPKNLLKTIAVGVGCAALVAVTGGAATPFLIAGGVAMGAAQAGVGVYKATQANTDAEKRAALEDVGGGTANVAMSLVAAKGYTAKTGNSLLSAQTYKTAATESVANIKMNFGNLSNSVKTAGVNLSERVSASKADFTQSVTERARGIENLKNATAVSEGENGFALLSDSATENTAISKTSYVKAAAEESAARLRAATTDKIAAKTDAFKTSVKSNLSEDGQAFLELVQEDPKGAMAAFGKEYMPEVTKATFTSVKQLSAQQLSNVKSFVASAKENMSVSQMVSKLGEMGLDKSTAMEIINASNTAVNVVDTSDYETTREFSYT